MTTTDDAVAAYQAKVYDNIIEEYRNGIVWLTINRPDRRNALSPAARAELTDGISRAGSNPVVAAIVITGAGEKAFCSGGDHTYERGLAASDAPVADVPACFEAMRRSKVPLIAAVRGFAVGSGVPLAYLCDLTVAAEDARFYLIEPKLGSSPAGFDVAFLSRIIGEKRAREMWYLGKQYSATEAHQMGLVNEVFPVDGFLERVQEYAEVLLRRSPTTLRLLKASFDMAADGLRHMRSDNFVSMFAPEYMDNPEISEGLRALKEDREPDFSPWRRPR